MRKDTLNGRIALHKRPYFFRYLYNDVNKDYERFLEDMEIQSRYRFGMKLEDLLKVPNKTAEELDFCDYVNSINPIVDSNSVMNSLCHHIEEFRKTVKTKLSANSVFPYYQIYRNNELAYTRNMQEEIVSKYVQATHVMKFNHNIKVRDYSYLQDWAKLDLDEGNVQPIDLEAELLEICSNVDIIVNVLVDYIYHIHPSASKALLWKTYGNVIVKNVLKNSGYKIMFPFRNENGELSYMGNKYSLREVDMS